MQRDVDGLVQQYSFEGSGVFGVGASLILLWLCEGVSCHVLEQVQIDSASMFSHVWLV